MRRLAIAAIMVMAVVMLSTAVLGGTPCAHFTGNRHDTLLIGEIIATGDGVIVIRPTGFIISAGTRYQYPDGGYTSSDREIARMLRHETARQLRPDIAVVYMSQYWMDGTSGKTNRRQAIMR